MEELCVGDDARDVTDLPWDPVTDPRTGAPVPLLAVSASYLDRLARAVRADEATLRAIAPYWALKAVDRRGLQELMKVGAICESEGVGGRFRGTYTNERSEKTVVRFEPVAAAPGARPRLVVASIVRYPATADLQALREAQREAAERYRELPAYAGPERPGAAWISLSSRGPHLRLLAPLGDPRRTDQFLRGHPECDDNRAAESGR